MQQYITIFLTAVVTVTTIIYTVYSVLLWKTTKRAADISRQAAMSNLWAELNRYIEISKQEGNPHAEIMQQLSGIFAEYMLTSLMSEVNTRKDPHVAAFKQKIENLVRAKNFDVTSIPWLAPFLHKDYR